MTGSSRGRPAGAARPGWRNCSALFLGKALIAGTRLLKRGGTTLPGRAALKVSPQLISHLSRQIDAGSIIITGTNGKTTTAALLAAIFKEAGRDCVHNAAGSNLSWGVASTLIEAATWRAGLNQKHAVLEVDEGAFPALVKNLHPCTAVVTNIFSDQLDRFGSPEQVRQAIEKGLQALPPEALILLNADDPLVASLGGSAAHTLYFGLEPPPETSAPLPPQGKQLAPPCPHCRRELHYSRFYFAHLGRYRCPSCGFARPQPEFRLRPAPPSGEKNALTLSLRGVKLKTGLPLPGIYNLYNALAAAAAASACNLPHAAIAAALAAATPPAGRMEQRQLGSKKVLTALIKNPAGADAVLHTLVSETAEERLHFLIAINDRPADGTDTSWLWDADFEQLAALQPRTGGLFLSGTKAGEVKQRLEKAGFESAGMAAIPSLSEAFRKAAAAAAPGEKLIILANYTALQQLHRLINR